MNDKLQNILNSYSIFTYYDEVRNDSGELIFCNGHSFDKVGIDDITRYIMFSSKKDPNSICMINPKLDFQVIHLKYGIDKLIFLNNNYEVKKFFCKK